MRQEALNRSKGYSLIELMIGLSLGLVLTMGITSIYVQSKNNYERIAEETTRSSTSQYIGSLLRREIQGAGYWGELIDPDPRTTYIDPCVLTITNYLNGIYQPVFGFNSPGSSPLSCIANNNFVPGTDILILRRASSLPITDAAGSNPIIPGDVYIQTNPASTLIEIGASSYVPPKLNADNSVAQEGTTPAGNATTVKVKRNIDDPGDDPELGVRLGAEIRKYVLEVFFVSPCTISADGTGVCTGTDDDGGEPLPSLKKLELRSVNGVLQLETQVLAEGVEDMQIQYGIDTSAAESLGSGGANLYKANPTADEFKDVVSVQVAVLMRDNVNSGFVDTNTYTLLDKVVGPFNDIYPRNVLNGNYRIVNLSMRRAGSN